jgi:hypothetical protein
MPATLFPSDYLIASGIAYNRNTWYSAPPCQFNRCSPIEKIASKNGMAFHPRDWRRSVKSIARTRKGR